MTFAPLPPSFAATREALRALACYAISPARKAQTGRIGLRPTDGGFGTPPLPDRSRIVVAGDEIARRPGPAVRVTTVREAAAFLGIEVSADPGVGRDLPPYRPDDALAVDAAASTALGRWYAFGADVLDRLRGSLVTDLTEAQLWPEHFDLAVTAPGVGSGVNIGFSPGDAAVDHPYVYVGPHEPVLTGPFWNAPWGAFVTYDELRAADDPAARALAFIEEALRRVGDGDPLLDGRPRTG